MVSFQAAFRSVSACAGVRPAAVSWAREQASAQVSEQASPNQPRARFCQGRAGEAPQASHAGAASK